LQIGIRIPIQSAIIRTAFPIRDIAKDMVYIRYLMPYSFHIWKHISILLDVLDNILILN